MTSTRERAIEAGARAMANAKYEARIAVIAASRNTDRPISYPGPFDCMDYLLSAEMWDDPDERGAGFIKDCYRAEATAAFDAILSEIWTPSAEMVEAGFQATDEAVMSDIRYAYQAMIRKLGEGGQ